MKIPQVNVNSKVSNILTAPPSDRLQDDSIPDSKSDKLGTNRRQTVTYDLSADVNDANSFLERSN